MPKINKKLVLILFLVFILMPIFYAVSSLKKIKTPTESETSSTSAGPIQLDSDYLTPRGVQYQFVMQDIEVPKTLPLVEVDKQEPMSEERVVELGNKTGLGEYTRKYVNAQNQRLYLFKKGNESMTIRADSNELSYRTVFTPNILNSGLSDGEIQEIAASFLIDKFGLERNNLYFSFIGYSKEGDEHPILVDRNEANMFKVGFSPISLGYKIISINPQEAPISVWVKADGTIAKAEIAFFGNIKKTETEYSTISTEELKENTNSIQIIQTIVDNIVGIKYPEKDLRNITVTKMEIAYFYNSASDTKYQPIYLMEGLGQSPQLNYPVKLVLFSPAIK